MAAGKDSDDFQHCALFYTSQEQYLGEVSAFVRAALARGDPVLITVPGIRAGPLRDVLGPQARQVIFAGMDELGRNPGRIIPAVHAFLDCHPAARPHWVSESAWPARSAPELVETARHEALCNRAFAGVPIAALCPYDVAGLPATVLAAAEQTHPLLARPGGPLASPAYLGPEGMPAYCQAALPAPPAGAEALRYRTDLRPVRALAGRWAIVAGLSPNRAADLVLAVSEVAANTLSHTRGAGTVRAWQDPGALVCEISDAGWIADPLADRPPPAAEGPLGHGLWVVHQICDLVQIRTGPQGTTVRLHMDLRDQQAADQSP